MVIMKSSYELPCELTTCILTRLSVKDFLRFRCVSKSWRALIDDPFFVKKHLRRSIYESENNGVSCSGVLVGMEKCKTAKIVHPTLSFRFVTRIIGASNGFLCVSGQSRRFGTIISIWNLSTGKSHDFRPVPVLVGSSENYSYEFGYDRISNDYKVISIITDDCNILATQILVYSLGKEAWRQMSSQDYDDLYILEDHGTFVRSANSIYWAFQGKTKTTNPYLIDGIDLRDDNVYLEVEQPNYDTEIFYIFAGELRECLCLYSLYSGSRHIWQGGEHVMN